MVCEGKLTLKCQLQQQRAVHLNAIPLPRSIFTYLWVDEFRANIYSFRKQAKRKDYLRGDENTYKELDTSGMTRSFLYVKAKDTTSLVFKFVQ